MTTSACPIRRSHMRDVGPVPGRVAGRADGARRRWAGVPPSGLRLMEAVAAEGAA